MLFFHIRSLETDFLQQFLQQGMEAAGTDILGTFIYIAGKLRQTADGLLLER